MPTKVIDNNLSILIDKSKFEKARQIQDPQELETCLPKLMHLANKHYNTVYRQYKNNPDIEKFNDCKENFQEIKSIIEEKGNPSSTHAIHLESWISLLYSDVHALNLSIKTKKQLNRLNQKIQDIETNLKQIVRKKSTLNPKKFADLLNYIDAFHKTWENKKNRLKGDYYYNYALTLDENNEKSAALKNYEKSAYFYRQAAEFAKSDNKENLLKFEAETKEKIKELKRELKILPDSSPNKNPAENPKITVVLTRLPPSGEITGIKTEPVWTIASKKTLEELPKSETIRSTKNKRKSFDNIYPAKKLKLNGTKDFWNIEQEKILNTFKQLNIAIDLVHLSNSQKTFDERKAIAHNNYAIFLIEDLNNKEKNYSYSKKIAFLNKVVEFLTKSAEIYKSSNLTEEKNNIEHCITTISSSLKNLEANKMTKAEDSSSIKTQASGISEKKLREYQHPLSPRIAYKFFNASPLAENNTQNTNPQNKKDSSCFSLARSNK